MGHGEPRRKVKPMSANVRLLIGVVILLAVGFGPGLAGALMTPAEIEESLRAIDGRQDVLVTMVPTAEQFHLQQLQDRGSLGRRIEKQTITFLRASQEDISWMSRQFWIVRVEPAP